MLLQTNGYLIVIMEKYEITEASRAKGGLLLLLRAVPKGLLKGLLRAVSRGAIQSHSQRYRSIERANQIAELERFSQSLFTISRLQFNTPH